LRFHHLAAPVKREIALRICDSDNPHAALIRAQELQFLIDKH
jgi:hypothetical protein